METKETEHLPDVKNKMTAVERLINLFKIKSPCCKSHMSSVFDLEHDFLVYECVKCKKQWI